MSLRDHHQQHPPDCTGKSLGPKLADNWQSDIDGRKNKVADKCPDGPEEQIRRQISAANDKPQPSGDCTHDDYD